MLPEAEEGIAGRPEGLGRPAKVLAAPFPRPHLHHLLQRLNVEAWHPSRHAAHRKGEAAGRQARSRVALAARHSGGLRRNSAEFKQREEALQARGRHPSIASHSHRAWADPKLDNAPNACIRHCGEQPYTFTLWTRRWVQGGCRRRSRRRYRRGSTPGWGADYRYKPENTGARATELQGGRENTFGLH